MITYKKLIGEGITDSNGECSVGYVGKDEATLNIKAEAVNLTATTQIQVNYGLLLTSNKKIIQTGETATLTAKIPPKQGVIIENQTVYLSKIIDDSDLSLELTASTNIIQAGNNLTLTAKVTDSNDNNIENIIVNLFKESDSMAKELVATLVTDSNGEASYNYVGVGAGKIDFSAESGILQSETYEVLDCDFYDEATTTNHNDNRWDTWSSYPVTVTRQTEYTLIEQATSGTIAYHIFPFADLNPSIIEFDFYKNGGLLNEIIGQLRNNNKNVLRQFSLSSVTGTSLETWYHIKLDFDNKLIYIDDKSIVMDDITPTHFYIVCYTTTTDVRYKNFKVY